MFGILLANIDSLDAEENGRYREVYCGICHSLKERYGQVSRVCVNYDMVLVALLRESLFEHGEEVSHARCLAHPAKQHHYAQSPDVDYAADMSVLFAYHKCLDDWNDDKRKAAKVYSSALGRAYRRVKAQYPEQCALAEQELAAIRSIEGKLKRSYQDQEPDQEHCRDAAMAQADEIAKRFGLITSIVFSADGGWWQGDLAEFGAEIGRFVYFMDALLDIQEDKESGSFNPFNLCETPDEDAELLLKSIMGRALDRFERLPLERDLNLMRSILYAGVWQRLRAQRQERDSERSA